MTRTIEGNFWCCAAKQRPQEILFHSPTRGRAVQLTAEALFYCAFLPLFFRTKRAAKAESDKWNAEFDASNMRVAPRRIRVVIDIDDGKRNGAKP